MNTDAKLLSFAQRYGLTPREADVVRAVCAGATTNAQIARVLGVARGTVQGFLHLIYLKTQTASKADLILKVFAGNCKL